MTTLEQIQNNWPTIKAHVLNRWSKLSEAEVEKTHGAPKALGQLVERKYGHHAEFEKTYKKMCEQCFHSSKDITPHTSKPLETQHGLGVNKQADGVSDVPSEKNFSTESLDETFQGDFPEKRANAAYTKFDHNPNINREADDDLSAYSSPARTSLDDGKVDDYYNQLDDELDANFTSPDEFYPSQDPSASSDIPLGRVRSSATNLSSAKAAQQSSEVSFNDAKSKL